VYFLKNGAKTLRWEAFMHHSLKLAFSLAKLVKMLSGGMKFIMFSLSICMSFLLQYALGILYYKGVSKPKSIRAMLLHATIAIGVETRTGLIRK
jgi:hypothetical protein